MGRKFQIDIGNLLLSTYNMENGISQGSEIRPMLFTVMMDDISTYIPRQCYMLMLLYMDI